MTYSIDQKLCTGCARCLDACNASAIFLVDGKARIDENLCRDCGACFRICPQGAIQEERSLVKQSQAVSERKAAPPAESGFKKAAIAIGSTLASFAISKLVSNLSDSRPGQPANSEKRNSGRGAGCQRRNRRGRNR